MDKFDKTVNTLLEVYKSEHIYNYLNIGHDYEESEYEHADAWGFKYNSDDIFYASEVNASLNDFHGEGIADFNRPTGRIDHDKKIISIAYRMRKSDDDVELARRILKMDYPDYKIKLFDA